MTTFEDIITSLGFMIEIGKYAANNDVEYIVWLGMLNKRIYNIFKLNNIYIKNIKYNTNWIENNEILSSY